MARVVYNNGGRDGMPPGTLFHGRKFWLSLNVPSRKKFAGDISANGGILVHKEAEADVLIVDHLRKGAPSGSHSYRYIELSVRNGVLEDLEKHRVGSAVPGPRVVGAGLASAKTTRTPFTAEDDRVLLDWVSKNPQKGGGNAGNETYKQLAQHNPRHPWQSWRDRFVVRYRNRASNASVPKNAPPTPPNEAPKVKEEDEETTEAHKSDTIFSEEERDLLLRVSRDVLNLEPGKTQEAWSQWAFENPAHSNTEWQEFWEGQIKPIYLRAKAQRRQDGETSSQESEDEDSEVGAVEEKPIDETDGPSPSRKPLRLVGNDPAAIPANNSDREEVQSDSQSGGDDLPARKHIEHNANQKRKRSPMEDSFPQSSPPRSISRSLAKRPRLHFGNAEEIPSTPERNLAINTPSNGPNPYHRRQLVVDDGSDVDTARESGGEIGDKQQGEDESKEAKEIQKDDDDDDDDQEDASDEDSPAHYDLTASPTLSEPDYHTTQQSIDAQISAEIYFSSLPQDKRDKNDDEDGPLETESNGPEIAETQFPEPASQVSPSAEPMSSPPQLRDPPRFIPAAFRSSSVQASPEPPLSHRPPSHPPGQKGAIQPGTEQPDMNAQVDDWIEKHLSKGARFKLLDRAIFVTGMDLALAETVLPRLQEARKVPQDMPGIWTESDDAALRAGGGAALASLVAKHGRERVDKRPEFLRAFDEE